jgi:hypothetical protein
MAKNETRYKQAMQLLRRGESYALITSITGFNSTVLDMLKRDLDKVGEEDE